MPSLAALLERVNFRIPGPRWQLLEFSDLWIVPPFIKHDQQDALTARWTNKIPLLQSQTPAELAADAVTNALQSLPDLDSTEWNVIDFGSGSGGPTPFVEMLVNHGRRVTGRKPIPFQLSDIKPNLDVWMKHSMRSENLSFIPQPVDAANPVFSAISVTTEGDREAAHRLGFESNGCKVFRLYCATFHQFDDPRALAVMRSTLDTSDGFAIIELQERTIMSLLLVLLEAWLGLFLAIVWFWGDEVHLFFTYVVPVLPGVMYFDGLVSCLRTRTFEETLRLVLKAGDGKDWEPQLSPDKRSVVCGEWQFRFSRARHMWPIGHMHVITGTKISSDYEGAS